MNKPRKGNRLFQRKYLHPDLRQFTGYLISEYTTSDCMLAETFVHILKLVSRQNFCKTPAFIKLLQR